MCDFCSNGIWAKSGSMADLEELPVDADTIFMLGGWQNWHDSRNSDDPIPGLDQFVKQGWRIVDQIVEQLPDWTVVYFDEKRRQHLIKVKLYFRPRT